MCLCPFLFVSFVVFFCSVLFVVRLFACRFFVYFEIGRFLKQFFRLRVYAPMVAGGDDFSSRSASTCSSTRDISSRAAREYWGSTRGTATTEVRTKHSG